MKSTEKDQPAPTDPFLVAVQALSASMIELDHTIEMVALVEKDIAAMEQQRKAEIRAQATGGTRLAAPMDDASSVASHGGGSAGAEAMLRTSHLEVAPPRASAAEIRANIASKRKATLGAAAFLRQSAARLSSVALADRRFFAQLSDLRKRWLLCVVDASGRDASGDAVGEDGGGGGGGGDRRGRAVDGGDGGRKVEAGKVDGGGGGGGGGSGGGPSGSVGERFVLRSANNLAFDCGLYSAGGRTGDGGELRGDGDSSSALWSGAAARGRARVLTQIRRVEGGRLEVLPPAAPLGPGTGGSLGATGASGGSYAHLALRVTVTMAAAAAAVAASAASAAAAGGQDTVAAKGQGKAVASRKTSSRKGAGGRRKRKREDDDENSEASSSGSGSSTSSTEASDAFVSSSAAIRAAPPSSPVLTGNEENEMELRRVRHSALCAAVFDALAAEAAALGDMVGDAGAVAGESRRRAAWRGSGAGWLATALPLGARPGVARTVAGAAKGTAGAGPFSLFSILQSTASAVEVRASTGLRLRVELVRDGEDEGEENEKGAGKGIGSGRGSGRGKGKGKGKGKGGRGNANDAARLAAAALASTAAAAIHSAAISGFRRRRRARRAATLLVGMDAAGAAAAQRRLLRACGPGLVLFPAVLRLRHRERSAEVAAELTRLGAALPFAIKWGRSGGKGTGGGAGGEGGKYSGKEEKGDVPFLSTSWAISVDTRAATVTLRTFGAGAGNAWAWDAGSARRNEAFCSSALRSPGDSALAAELEALPGVSCAVVGLAYCLLSLCLLSFVLSAVSSYHPIPSHRIASHRIASHPIPPRPSPSRHAGRARPTDCSGRRHGNRGQVSRRAASEARAVCRRGRRGESEGGQKCRRFLAVVVAPRKRGRSASGARRCRRGCGKVRQTTL